MISKIRFWLLLFYLTAYFKTRMIDRWLPLINIIYFCSFAHLLLISKWCHYIITLYYRSPMSRNFYIDLKNPSYFKFQKFLSTIISLLLSSFWGHLAAFLIWQTYRLRMSLSFPWLLTQEICIDWFLAFVLFLMFIDNYRCLDGIYAPNTKADKNARRRHSNA